MNPELEKEVAAFKEGEGKLKKLFASIKKLISKEFLWVLVVLLLGLPLALILTYLFETHASEEMLVMTKKILEGNPLFIGAYMICLGGIYFTRMVVGAIKTATKKPAS